MLEKAIRLCSGIQGALWTIDGGRAKAAASHCLLLQGLARLGQQPRVLHRDDQEKVRSTTKRRGSTTKPSLRLTIAMRSGGTFATAASTCQAL